MNRMLGVAALFLATGALACSSDVLGPSELNDDQIDADIAAASGANVAAELASFDDNVAAAGSFTVVAPNSGLKSPVSASVSVGPVAPTCTYSAGRYSCAATNEQGLSVTRSFAFYDANGSTVQTFDATKVESVNFQAQIDGSFQPDLFWTAGVHRTRNVTVSGLISQAPHRVWNGVGLGADTVTHIALDGIRSLAGAVADTVTNLVMPGKDAASQNPLSGTVVVAADYTASLQGATGTVSKQVKRRVVVTFDGTASASLAIGSLECVLHLDTKRVDSCQ